MTFRTVQQGYGPILVGMRGSGKSSVAGPLAARLEMVAVDADAEVERQTGRSIAEIFARDGEAAFRQIEQEVLLETLLPRRGIVLATGGGAVLHAPVREQLVQRLTVWLHAPIDILAARIGGTDRPSLTGGGIAEELALVLSRREALYDEVARLTVDTSRAEIDGVVEQIYRAACGETTTRTG